jgi:hypothetical protein
MLRDNAAIQAIMVFIDPKDIFILMSGLAALTCFWTMQCITVHAGIRTGRTFAMLALRIAFLCLTAALLFPAYQTASYDVEPTGWDILLVTAILCILLTLPFAIGGRVGADLLNARIR